MPSNPAVTYFHLEKYGYKLQEVILLRKHEFFPHLFFQNMGRLLSREPIIYKKQLQTFIGLGRFP